MAKKKASKWPLYLIGSSAAVAVWSGWVGLGGLSGFGVVHPLPGIWGSFEINTAITLPIGVEAYGAYAMGTWLDKETPKSARRFAKWSSIGSLLLGMLGQIAYHLLTSLHRTAAPWETVTLVSCLPVVTLGFAAALHHLRNVIDDEPEPELRLTPREMEQIDKALDEEPRQMPKLAATLAATPPWDDTSWSPPPPTQPTFTPVTQTGAQPALGTVNVRGPLGRADRKIPVDERVAARLTGSFPAVPDTGMYPTQPGDAPPSGA